LRELCAVWEINARFVENPRESGLSISFPETIETKKNKALGYLRKQELVNHHPTVAARPDGQLDPMRRNFSFGAGVAALAL
jgi:hypothetical protein